ncbi:hypothetical protein ACXN5S_08275 [Pseudoroseicyclus sp. H15]
MKAAFALMAIAGLAACSVNPDRITGGPDQSPLIEFNGGLFGGTTTSTPAAQAPETPVVPANAEDRLVAAIEANGCVLTAGNVDSVLLQANLTTDQLRAVTETLVDAGRAELSGEGAIRVMSTNCI